jgi:hypothetical protein
MTIWIAGPSLWFVTASIARWQETDVDTLSSRALICFYSSTTSDVIFEQVMLRLPKSAIETQYTNTLKFRVNLSWNEIQAHFNLSSPYLVYNTRGTLYIYLHIFSTTLKWIRWFLCLVSHIIRCYMSSSSLQTKDHTGGVLSCRKQLDLTLSKIL